MTFIPGQNVDEVSNGSASHGQNVDEVSNGSASHRAPSADVHTGVAGGDASHPTATYPRRHWRTDATQGERVIGREAPPVEPSP